MKVQNIEMQKDEHMKAHVKKERKRDSRALKIKGGVIHVRVV